MYTLIVYSVYEVVYTERNNFVCSHNRKPWFNVMQVLALSCDAFNTRSEHTDNVQLRLVLSCH